jgi:hypothetical protein
MQVLQEHGRLKDLLHVSLDPFKYQVKVVKFLRISRLQYIVQLNNVFARKRPEDLNFSEESLGINLIVEQIKNLFDSHFLPTRSVYRLTNLTIAT